MTEQAGDQSREIGFRVRVLSHAIKKTVDRMAGTGNHPHGEITRLHAWVLGYLYDHRDQDVYQKDIQAQFSISRSTTTGMLQVMEKNGLITRESVEWDARLKKLRLTPKAIQMEENLRSGIKRTEQSIAQILTSEERETFFALCGKLAQGIREMEQQSQNRKDEEPHD